jgi:hypothetical protein
LASCQSKPGQLELEGLRDENGDYIPMQGLDWGLSVSEVEKVLNKSLGNIDSGPIMTPSGNTMVNYYIEGLVFDGHKSRAEYCFIDDIFDNMAYSFSGYDAFDSLYERLVEIYGEPYEYDESDLTPDDKGYTRNVRWIQIHDDYFTAMQLNKNKFNSETVVLWFGITHRNFYELNGAQ